MTLSGKIPPSELCKDCPLDPISGQCKEHSVLLGVSKTGIRILLMVAISIFGTLAALHWRVGGLSDSIATTQKDVEYLAGSLDDIRQEVKQFLWRHQSGD